MSENKVITRILTTLDEYNESYDLKENKWREPCGKNTSWCFNEKYNIPNYGHMYNKELFTCCNDNLIY